MKVIKKSSAAVVAAAELFYAKRHWFPEITIWSKFLYQHTVVRTADLPIKYDFVMLVWVAAFVRVSNVITLTGHETNPIGFIGVLPGFQLDFLDIKPRRVAACLAFQGEELFVGHLCFGISVNVHFDKR